ncbi:hypothetical protein ACFQ4M_04485 [Thauera mechernichensis]|uniref:DUF7939 domain-containing protein n=1 Tax=Thauera mechernichensis TaxID=82788 RepID=A0ABW3WAH4_9RHOO|nr:hypothetical protein [Thauera mechernichensis]MDG3066134.1 hypothetical protein [Thauera mechernichensis]
MNTRPSRADARRRQLLRMTALLVAAAAVPGRSFGRDRAAPEARLRWGLDTAGQDDDAAFELGEPIIIRLEVWVSTWFQAPVDFPATLATGSAIVEEIGGSPEAAFDDIDGRRWTGLIRRYRVHPLQPGELILGPPAALEIRPGRGDGRPLRASPPTPLRLAVRLPKGAEGLNPFVAARSLALQQQWEPTPDPDQGWQVGDMLRRRITLVTDAPSPLPPTVPALASAEGTELQRHSTPARTAEADSARTVQEHVATYVLKAPGALHLPAVELAWWDLDQRKVRISHLPGRTVTVSATSMPADPFAEPGSEPGADAPDDSHRTVTAQAWRWIPAGALTLALGTWAWRHRSALAATIRRPLQRLHASETTARWRLRRACLQSRPAQAAAAFRVWLRTLDPASRRRIHADTACAEAMEALVRHLHGPQAPQRPVHWNGPALWHAVQRAHATLASGQDLDAALPELNPRMQGDAELPHPASRR